MSDLTLDLRKMPRNAGVAKSISEDEWVVSPSLAEQLLNINATGVELRAVRHRAFHDLAAVNLKKSPSGKLLLRKATLLGFREGTGEFYAWLNRAEQRSLLEAAIREYHRALSRNKRYAPPPVWYQLVLTSKSVRTIPPTRFGLNPFDEDTKGEYRCPFGHVAGLNLLSELTVQSVDWEETDFARTVEYVGCSRGVVRPAPLLLVSPRIRKLFADHKVRGCEFEVAHLT